MELTQEYFDQKLSGLATKNDLTEQTKELKTFAVEQTEELARIIATTIAEPMEQRFNELHNNMDVKAEVQELKRDMLKIETALHLST